MIGAARLGRAGHDRVWRGPDRLGGARRDGERHGTAWRGTLLAMEAEHE